MIEVYFARDIIQAELVRLLLGRHGIRCTQEPDYGERIFVESKDAEKTLEILTDWEAGLLPSIADEESE